MNSWKSLTAKFGIIEDSSIDGSFLGNIRENEQCFYFMEYIKRAPPP